MLVDHIAMQHAAETSQKCQGGRSEPSQEVHGMHVVMKVSTYRTVLKGWLLQVIATKEPCRAEWACPLSPLLQDMAWVAG